MDPGKPQVTRKQRLFLALWPVTGYALVLSTGDRQQRYRVIHQYG